MARHHYAAESSHFRRVFEAEYPLVVRHLVYMTGDRHLAEDLAQEAFSRLLDRGPGAGLLNPRAWLLTVASNLAVNSFRSEARRIDREKRAAPEAVVADSTEVIDVRDALERLEPRDRAALLLRDAGFSYAEIADAVGLKPSSVGTILARAQCRFREAYAPSSTDSVRQESRGEVHPEPSATSKIGE